MLDDLLGEKHWRWSRVRNHMKGVTLESPSEELEEEYFEVVEDVETFTGAEFDEVPEFWVVSEDTTRNPMSDGVYLEDANAVVFNPNNMNRLEDEDPENYDWEHQRTHLRELKKLTSRDVLLEELVHGLQDQKAGVANLEHTARDHYSRKLGLRNIPVQPEFSTEGFADYVTSYLGNQSLDLTEAAVHLAGAKKENELQNQSLLSGVIPSGPSKVDVALDHAAERYVGHLFYSAVEEEGGVDAVMEEAFDPRGYEDLSDVFHTIEESGVNLDDEVYMFSKEYLRNEHGV